MPKNQSAHVAGLLVLSLLVCAPVYAQSEQPEACGTPEACLEQFRSVLAGVRDWQTEKMRLENRVQELENQIGALNDGAPEVRVQTGVVNMFHNRRGHPAFPELMQPNCDGYNERGIKDGRVDFPEPFASVPKVSIALHALDMAWDVNVRLLVAVIPNSIDRRGFRYRFFTWCDSLVVQARASWIAVADTSR